jgi:anti-anti-sigma regulatory factor
VAGIVRLLNTAGGRVLCLAGAVDAAAVDAFLRRYGREPARVDVIDAGSVTSLSAPGVELLREHLETAEQAGREVPLRRSPVVERALSSRGVSVSAADRSRKSPDRPMRRL